MIGTDVRPHCIELSFWGLCRHFVECLISTPRTRVFGGAASADQTKSGIRRERLQRIRKQEHSSGPRRNRDSAVRLELVEAI